MSDLKIYNSLHRKKQEFIPIEKGKVGLYVCGVTVYDFCHIGHARVMIVFDMIVRWFKELGYEVNYVQNITDIDDKIIQRAIERLGFDGETTPEVIKKHGGNERARSFLLQSIEEARENLTTIMTDNMQNDRVNLGCLHPQYEPKATEHIPQIIELIQNLMDKGYAYQGENGDIFYAVRKFADYGKLSGRSIDDLQVGSRIGIDETKNDPLDFVLWKQAKEGEPFWESPWGSGRPGWHIECSAMAKAHLGAHFDIHGGGQDLLFPHHENEIAQSSAGFGCAPANYWIHNGFVQVDNEKMSKSLGNFFRIDEVLQKYHPEVLRFFMLRTHYRSPLNWSAAEMDSAKEGLTRIYLALRDFSYEELFSIEQDKASAYYQRFQRAMNDDFNTPLALFVLFDMVNQLNLNQLNRTKDRALASRLYRTKDTALASGLYRTKDTALASGLLRLGRNLGFFSVTVEDFLRNRWQRSGFYDPQLTKNAEGKLESKFDTNPVISDDFVKDIEEKIAQRKKAREAKDFATADKIRAELLEKGIILEDIKEPILKEEGAKKLEPFKKICETDEFYAMQHPKNKELLEEFEDIIDSLEDKDFDYIEKTVWRMK